MENIELGVQEWSPGNAASCKARGKIIRIFFFVYLHEKSTKKKSPRSSRNKRGGRSMTGAKADDSDSTLPGTAG